ncbi:MAG: phage tail assembly chaperone [Pseudomonadota bacterium]
MAFGLGILRLPPDAFWAMTPRELAAAMGRVDRNQIVTTRRWLDEAASRYPDVATDPKETSDG